MDLKFNGFTTVTEPVGEGDVALVIRADGRVEAMVKDASEDGREFSADMIRLQAVYGLIVLAAQPELMKSAMAEAGTKMRDAMKPRLVTS